MLRLTQWMAEYYLCPWPQVLDAVVPAAVREQAGTRLVTLLSVPTRVAARLAQLELPAKQLAALQALAASSTPLSPQQLARRIGSGPGPITALRRRGLVESTTKRLAHGDHDELPATQEEDHVLNEDQQQALDTILAALQAQRHEPILLHGITGSGKTEVYIRAIQEVVRYGRQAIVLVPEISLTPQTRQRFRARFPQVAVLHSHLSDAERHWHWQRIARGEVNVVVGARSAIFAPVPNLGLIVIDEEHEASFKQETAPRYHARDVALRRAAEDQVPLVLGSATPALETWQRARQGDYRLVELPRRVMNRPLPDVVTIDLRNDAPKGQRGAISRQLGIAMQQALADGGQVILLLNRRGYATHIQCPACGEAVRCPHCDIALTHHRTGNYALCHYCDYQTPAPRECPACRSPEIRYSGFGTQKLEAEVQARFPDYPLLRMDTDTMQQPGSHERALSKFRDGEVRILLGTQMIAKGLDFPRVTLVGVINADTAMHLPDFRAAERTFQLIVQVAGRTGRGDFGGRVLVQTFQPDHPAIRAAVRHDYTLFALAELKNRAGDHMYPPFASMARLVVRGPVEEVADTFADTLARRIRAALDDDAPDGEQHSDGAQQTGHPQPAAEAPQAQVSGPAPAPISRLRNLYRFHILVRCVDGARLHAALHKALTDVQAPEHVQWIVDVDPLDML
jgi:primosomal protein N' (replication factor Y)